MTPQILPVFYPFFVSEDLFFRFYGLAIPPFSHSIHSISEKRENHGKPKTES